MKKVFISIYLIIINHLNRFSMNKLLSVLVILTMFFFASCSEKDLSSLQDGDERWVTFMAQLPGGLQSRAIGDGTTATTLSYAVYETGTQKPLITSDDKVTFENLTAKVALRLVTGKTYDIIFWADAADSPYTLDFEAQKVSVSYTGAFSNDEKRDAFFYVEKGLAITNQLNKTIELKRPFAQLNIGTNDTETAKKAGLEVKQTQVKVKAYSSLNFMDGSVDGEVDVTYNFATLPTNPSFFTVKDKGNYDYLAMNYLLVAEDKALVDCEFTLNDGTKDINTIQVSNVPVQRNYRTNIFGSLLTSAADFEIVISPDFETPDHDHSELLLAAEAGGTVTLTANVELDETLVVAEGKALTIDLNGCSITNSSDGAAIKVSANGELTINGDAGSTFTRSIINSVGNIAGGSGGNNVAVWAEKGSKVTINGGRFTVGPDADGLGNSCIYSTGGEVYINGGEFRSEAAYNGRYYVLNLQNGSNGKIVCTGGKFENFDPSGGDDHDQPTNFVAEGYSSIKVSDTPGPKGTFQIAKIGEKVDVEVSCAESFVGALSNSAVANIEVVSGIDLSTNSVEELTFQEYKTIDIKEGVTVKLGNSNWLTAEKGLTLTGKGTIDNTSEDNGSLGNGYQKSLIHVMNGACIIEGVTLINDCEYHWHGSTNTGRPYNSAAVAYWNDTDVTIKNAKIYSGEFAVCGMGRDVASGEITLVGSYFESTSSNKDNGMHWAYAMRLFGSKVRIENCEVKGIQGAISVEGCQDVIISSGKYYTVNTEGQKDAFYALYITNGAKVTITGGEFIGANDWSSSKAEGTSAVVSGDNDSGLPVGSVVLQGGKFSGKAYNHETGAVYNPSKGYKWQAIEGDGDLKWKVVAAE
jgi:hypothetical protein